MEPPRDAVEATLGQWARQHPDLDVRPLAVIDRIARAGRVLEREQRKRLAEHGVQDWEFDVLATLHRNGGGPVTAGVLVASCMVTPASMTNRIDRLEAKGLVSRRTDPRNRRSVLVTLTDDGRRVVGGALAAHLEHAAELLAGLGPTNQRRLAALLRRLLVTLGDIPG